jgi:hypothetical protein
MPNNYYSLKDMCFRSDITQMFAVLVFTTKHTSNVGSFQCSRHISELIVSTLIPTDLAVIGWNFN